MKNQQIIQKTIDYVKSALSEDKTGHDWFHTMRVWNLSKIIAEKENITTKQIANIIINKKIDVKNPCSGNANNNPIIIQKNLLKYGKNLN